MSWQIISLVNGLGEWCGEWDRLNRLLYGGHPFNDSRFVDAMLRHFGSGSERLYVHRREGRIDGMLLLYPRQIGIWSQFVPAQAQTAPPLIERRDVLAELFSVLPRKALAVEFLCQDPLYTPAGLLEEDAKTRLLDHALTMNIDLRGSFGEYWEGRSKNLIKNMRRYSNRVQKSSGSAEMKVLRAPGEMKAAVARYSDLEAAGWKGRLETAINSDSAQGRFYAELMLRFAETGQGEIAEYWLGGRLAASRLIVSSGGMSIILKTAYDENLSEFAPGRMLLRDYIEYRFAEKRECTVEFYTNATPEQLSWATGQRPIYHVMTFRAAYQARLYALVQTLKRRRETTDAGDSRTAAGARHLPVDVEYCDGSALAEDCVNLFRTAGKDSFDLSEAWFSLMSENALPAGSRVKYIVIRRRGEPLGVVAVLVQPLRTRGWQGGSLSNFYTSLYRPALSPALGSDELAAALRGLVARERLDSLRFDAMDPDHPSFSLLESALRRAGLRSYRFFCFGNWFLPVEGRSFQEYFQGLPSRVRNTVRRGERKFFADGLGRLELITGNGLDQAIVAWHRVYEASWKIPEPYPKFVPGLIRLCAERGWLRLGIAYYDGQPVAAQLWIVSHGRAVIYKLAHDEKVAKLSVGTVLTAFLMAHVLDVDKVREVDYLIGDDAYKKDWMSHRRERWGIVAYNPRSVAGLAGLVVQVLGNLSRSLRGAAKRSAPVKVAHDI